MINKSYYFEYTYMDMIHDKYSRKIGDIVYCSDKNSLYVYNGTYFDKLCASSEATPKKKYSNKVLKCPNCGAPHKEIDEQCEYCGSYFTEEFLWNTNFM